MPPSKLWYFEEDGGNTCVVNGESHLKYGVIKTMKKLSSCCSEQGKVLNKGERSEYDVKVLHAFIGCISNDGQEQ